MNMHSRSHTSLMAALTIAALGLVSCASEPPKPLLKESLLEKTATVESINLAARLVSLRGEDGKLFTTAVSAEVKNLSQVKPGDRVVVSYYEGIAAEVKKPGEGVSGVQHTAGDVRAKPGERPSRAVGTMVQTTIQIQSVDTSFNTVTFKRPDGMVRTIAIESADGQRFIRELKPGDQVEVTYAEAFAVEVHPTK
jgi:hypothetical protein